MSRTELSRLAIVMVLGCGGPAQVQQDASAPAPKPASPSSSGGVDESSAIGSGADASTDRQAQDAGVDCASYTSDPPTCVLSAQYADGGDCTIEFDGSAFAVFECNPSCGEFRSVMFNGPILGFNGFTPCTLVELPDGGDSLRTDAGNIVMCCPVPASSFPCGGYCEPPFM